VQITAARVIVTCPGRNFVTLKIETDQGVYGIGDATLNGRELAVVAYLEEHVVPCLIGMDPRRITHRRRLDRRRRLRRGRRDLR
jgi:mannonate dehydratase